MTEQLYTPSIETRLALLPRKAAEPFRQLLATGQLSEDVVGIVLDAGEQSGDTNRLIAFAAGYFSMRLKNVPVHDVIAMARKNHRRINLAWSPSRWKDEHDKLSRLEALKRLAEDNVTYDVSAFARHLPTFFPGYIIRTSRKLGMEGLRQRHCIAAYHDKLKAGTCAILAMLIDRRRFTTELQLTGQPDAPLRIAQIRTRFNRLPDDATRAQIHALLGIAQPSSALSANPLHEDLHHYMDNLRAVLPVLRRHCITAATVTFNGGGDEGAIEDVGLTPASNAEAILNEHVTVLQRTSVFDDGQWIYQTQPVACTLSDAITAITDDYLAFTDIDWYNDSGGFGELEINVEAGTVLLEVSTRYEESTTEYSAEHDIETGAEL